MQLTQQLKRPCVWGPILAVVAIFVIAFAFFYPDASQGRVLMQSDMQTGLANGHEIQEYAAKTGETSYWTNSLFSGMPTYQISPAYASTSLLKWVNTLFGLGLPAPSNLLAMMMLGMLILLLVMRMRWPVALLGAVAWGFSSYFVILIGAGHIWKFATVAYVPPTLAGLILIYRGRRLWGAGLTALSFAMQLLNNHVQMTYYFGWVILGLVIALGVEAFRNKQMRSWLISSVVALCALGVGIAANLPSLYNTYEYSKLTIRGGHSELTSPQGDDSTGGLDRNYITAYSYGRSEMFSLLVPNINGGASARPIAGRMRPMTIDQVNTASPKQTDALLPYFSQYFGGEEGTNGPVYVGALIFALFVLGVFTVKGPLKWALLVLTLLSMGLAMGRNMQWFTDLFISFMPMYTKFRAVESILVIAELTIPLLAVLALAQLISEPRKINQRQLLYTFGTLSVICLIFIVMPKLFVSILNGNDYAVISQVESYYGASISGELAQTVMAAREQMIKSDAIRSLIILLLGGGALWLYKREKIGSAATIAAVGVITLVDLYTVDKRYLSSDSFTEPQPAQGFTPSVADRAILQDTDPDFRVLDIPGFSSSTSSYFHKAIGGYHAAKLTRYQDLIERQMMRQMNPAVINMLNTRYVIVNPDTLPEYNPDALGNGWFVDRLDYVDGADAEMAALDSLNPRTTAVADRAFASTLGTDAIRPDSIAYVRLTDYRPNRMTYDVGSSDGGVAVFSEIYFPGWTATVDGTPAEIGRVNYVLRAMRLPAGRHQVVMEFKPQAISTTNTVATVAIALTFALLIAAAAGAIVNFSRRPQEQE
jgi:hypothetical protein